MERPVLQCARGAQLGQGPGRASGVRADRVRERAGGRRNVVGRPAFPDALATLDDRAFCRQLDGQRPALPHPLHRPRDRQHPSAHRQRHLYLHPEDLRGRQRAGRRAGDARLVCDHSRRALRDHPAAAVWLRLLVSGLSDRRRPLLRLHRHADRPPRRPPPHPPELPAAAARSGYPFRHRAGHRPLRTGGAAQGRVRSSAPRSAADSVR